MISKAELEMEFENINVYSKEAEGRALSLIDFDSIKDLTLVISAYRVLLAKTLDTWDGIISPTNSIKE